MSVYNFYFWKRARIHFSSIYYCLIFSWRWGKNTSNKWLLRYYSKSAFIVGFANTTEPRMCNQSSRLGKFIHKFVYKFFSLFTCVSETQFIDIVRTFWLIMLLNVSDLFTDTISLCHYIYYSWFVRHDLSQLLIKWVFLLLSSNHSHALPIWSILLSSDNGILLILL